jgi:hypothetical protein
VHVVCAPVQAPLQPTNVELRDGVAVSVTDVPPTNDAAHSLPQLIPPGDDVTVPLPRPCLVTVSEYVTREKVAVTLRAWLMVTLHVEFVPLHAPDQRTNFEPDDGDAVRTTLVCAGNQALHVLPQSMPAGCELTVPPPLPSLATFSWRGSSTWQSRPDCDEAVFADLAAVAPFCV